MFWVLESGGSEGPRGLSFLTAGNFECYHVTCAVLYHGNVYSLSCQAITSATTQSMRRSDAMRHEETLSNMVSRVVCAFTVRCYRVSTIRLNTTVLYL